MWRTIGFLWMLLAGFVVSSPSVYAETEVTTRGSYSSSLGRWDKQTSSQEEALATQTGNPHIARLARERTPGNGDYTPPLASLLPSGFTTHRLEPGKIPLRSAWAIAPPRQRYSDATASRAPPFLP